MSAKGLALADLIDRYIEELYPKKHWGRSKSADLAALRRDLGKLPADKLTAAHFTDYFRDRHSQGAGAVTVSSQLGYLVGMLKVARTLWHLGRRGGCRTRCPHGSFQSRHGWQVQAP